ncbi:glutaminyl-tRNA synthetase [Perkinsela sp. CCAP 1560/4]|nr:glutaminyl-tRNA synthetase [Perkinsela sp. CCAP 1560/4]|eukprot:KNH09421.1 glutaminyl-tRNA synthetase [Perkinsela sp. CCAP 1560/4]
MKSELAKISFFKNFDTGREIPAAKNSPALLDKHRVATQGKLVFRFPPEPNGYLHIGHAKSMRLNFGEAQLQGGKCYLRYDDTNPEAECDEFITSIKDMVTWLGWKPDMITYSSDYFERLRQLAIELIKKGKAYVDHSTREEVKMQRADMTESIWRNRSVVENLALFEKMRCGHFAEGEATLRLKMDMQHENPNMRDVIAYRIKYAPHPHVGSQWCIYPSYDYTHCLVDSLEDVDYSLCTIEFETRRESYYWVLEALDLYRPTVWEFSRLNITGSLLSKRKINILVEKGIVRGFDDPRLLTLTGMRRRGYTPDAINEFCTVVGISRAENTIDIKLLEHVQRRQFDAECERRFGVIHPLLVVVNNALENSVQYTAPNHPKDETFGSRRLDLTKIFYIEASDFRKEDSRNYYGLSTNATKPVGLKYGPNMYYANHDENPKTGEVECVYVNLDFEKKTKPKTHIHWIAVENAISTEFRIYDPLLLTEKPVVENESVENINTRSETICRGFTEAGVEKYPLRTTFQFERMGYFTIDHDTEQCGHLVMNRVIPLREDAEVKKMKSME